jgi:hypothetical protein
MDGQKDEFSDVSALPIFLPAPSVWHDTANSLRHFSRNGQICTASRKGFFKSAKPLISLAKTSVKHRKVKYVFLAGGSKNRV